MKKTTTLAWLGAAAMLLASAVPAQAANYDLTVKSISPQANNNVSAADLKVVIITFNENVRPYGSATSTNNAFTKSTLKVGTTVVKAVGMRLKGSSSTYNSTRGTTTGLPEYANMELNTLALCFEEATNLPDGECTLTIEKGALSPVSGSYSNNNVFTTSWTIGSPDPFASATSTLDPAVGERTSLKDFTVTYSGLTGAINGVGNASDVTLNNGAGTVKEATGITYTDNSFTVSFDEITTPGEWTLNIPEGTALIDDAKSPAITPVTYTIPKPANPFAVYVITPEAREAYSLSQFEVAFPEFSGTPTIDSTKKATLNGVESTSIALNDGKVVITFPEVTKADTYTLSIPAGTVSDGTNANELIETAYTILNPLAATPVLDPESQTGHNSLKSFHVTYANAPEGYIAKAGNASAVTLLSGSETKEAVGINLDADGKGFTVEFNEVKKAGPYVLTIPAGTVTNAEGTNGNELIQAYYTIYNPFSDYTINPSAGEYTSLSKFEVAFSSAEATTQLVSIDTKATLGGVESTGITYNGDTKVLTVTFPEVTKAGSYELIIPAGTITDSANENYEIRANYTIADPFANPTITPADGKHLNTILEVSVTFENAFPEGTTLGDANTVTLTDGEGVSVNAVRVVEYEDRTGYDVIFDQISNDGTYTVNIPAGFLKYADNASAALQATYTIQKPTGVFANFTSEPAAGNWIPTATWSYIYVDFPDIPSDDVTGVGNIPATFSGIGTTPDLDVTGYSLTPNKVNQDGHLRLQYMYFNPSYINLNQLDGFYELTIPEGTFTYTTAARASERSPEIIIPYTIGNIATGIESVEASEDTVNVYDLTGRQLLKDADASELRTLANGLYIVNGKKVLLRR